MPDSEVTDLLREVPLFAGLDDRSYAEVARLSDHARIEAGGWLLRRGDEGDALHVVRSGRFEVVDEDRGQVVGVLGPGDMIGELALITGEPRVASVRARRDSEVVVIDRQAFAILLSSSPTFASSVTRTLGERFREQALGLASAATRRRTEVIALVGVTPVAPLQDVAHAMVAELGGPARVALLTGGDVVNGADGPRGTTDPNGAYGRALDACERAHEAVVLLATGQPEDAWTRFSLRSADRTVLVVPASCPPPDWAPHSRYAGCDLAMWSRHSLTAVQLAPWFRAVDPATHHWLRDGDGFRASVGRMTRRLVGRALGVVLSGGGARGYAHIGAVAALMDAGYRIDRLGGTSMGAFISGLLARERTPQEVHALCGEELAERRPFADYGVPTAGLIRGRRAEAMLQRVFGTVQIEELPLDWFSVSADLCSAETVVHRRGAQDFAVAASISLPGIAPPIPHGERLLVDGGVLNNLPVDVMAATQEGPVIAVDVMGRAGRSWGERRRLHARWRASPGRAPLPTIIETMAWASGLGSRRHVDAQRSLAALTIAPDLQDVGLLDWRALEAVVDRGRRAAELALEQAGGDLGAR